MVDHVEGKIDVEIRQVKMIFSVTFDARDLPDGAVGEPRGTIPLLLHHRWV